MPGAVLCSGTCIAEGQPCTEQCRAGTHDCNGICQPDTDVNGCGASCVPCPLPVNGAPTCDGVSCGARCNSGFHLCGGECVSNDSPNSCGASCTPCASPVGTTAACDGIRCRAECPAGAFFSGDACHIGATGLGLGLFHGCAVLRDSTLRCWGANESGQLGDGSISNFSEVPVVVRGLSGARAVGGGDAFSCALLSDGSVQCWGDNQQGQLGIGTSSAGSPLPVRVQGVEGALSIGVGRAHACAILLDDSVRCWGSNNFGQLGSGTSGQDGSAPLVVASLAGTPVQLAASSGGACAVMSTGSVQCWGFTPGAGIGSLSAAGALESIAEVPVEIGVAGARVVAAGYAHYCFVGSDGGVLCLGDNDSGQLGAGSISTGSVTPLAVQGLGGSRSAALGLGVGFSCALGSEGSVSCWGDNAVRQLGDASGVSSTTAVAVPGLSGAVALASGGFHSCVIAADGSVWCWGDASQGRLGGGAEANGMIPVQVVGW